MYQEPGWDGFGDDYPSVYSSVEMPMINEPLLRESSGLSDDALAEIVNDYSSVLKKLDSEEVDSADASAFASTGALSTWFDCFKDDICTVTKSTPKESALLVPKLSPADGPQDAAGVLQSVPKSRKSRKSVAGEQGHAQHDSEMDDVAPALIDEKRKRRCVFHKRLRSPAFFFSPSDEPGVEIFFDAMGAGCPRTVHRHNDLGKGNRSVWTNSKFWYADALKPVHVTSIGDCLSSSDWSIDCLNQSVKGKLWNYETVSL